MTEQYHPVNTKKIAPALLAVLIWVLTSLILGIGCFFYNFLFQSGEAAFISVLVTVCAGILSLPVLLVLSIAIPLIKNARQYPVGKVKRLLLTCFFCTLPYGLIIGCFYANKYENHSYLASYLLYALAACGSLFACSIVAMLITAKAIKHLFYTSGQDDFLIDQIGKNLSNEANNGKTS